MNNSIFNRRRSNKLAFTYRIIRLEAEFLIRAIITNDKKSAT